MSELLVLMEEATQRLGSPSAANAWLLTPVSPGGKRPIDYLATREYILFRGFLFRVHTGQEMFRPLTPSDRVYKERSSQEVKDALERLRPRSWRDEDEDTEELAELFAPGGPPDIPRLLTLTQKYDLELDMSSIMEISQKYHVSLGRAGQAT